MMNAKTVLSDALDLRWQKFCAELKHCRREFSEEAVHDLRVAARRLLALFDLLRLILHHKRIQKIRRELKDQLDDLDDLRDTQVLLADISESIHDLPELEAFQIFLQKQEKKYLRRAHKKIKARKIDRLSCRIGKMMGMIEDLPEEALNMQVIEAVDATFLRVRQHYEAMDIGNVASIHRLRIAFKRFRYTVEIAHPLFENFPAENFKRMHDYQSMMGDIQDMEVAQQNLTDLIESASFSAPEAVTDHYALRLRTAVLNFVEDKGELLTFWRSSPDHPFPWEKAS